MSFSIILLIILVVIFLFMAGPASTSNLTSNPNTQENFYSCPCKSRKLNKMNKYPYNPTIQTPQSNYNQIMSDINSQQYWKKDLSVALSPTPTIHCPELNNKTDCNKYGCNWFGSSNKKNSKSFCSSTYPTQF